jgi:lipopolysaccharide export system ATP-binding protein
MEDLGLTKLRHQKAMTLSGGERRRLEITRAMVTNPAFIMLDEPFSGVDPLAVSNVRDIILRLKNERNLGILITDHNVGDALKVVDRAYIMADGKVLVEGTSDYLINDPEAQKVYFGKDYKI